MGDQAVAVRPATPDDLAFMQEMLYEAANRPGDEWPPLDECINEPRNRRFWQGFPRNGDVAVVAERAGRPVGAGWIRKFTGEELSPIDDPAIPVLAIGVAEGERGKGIGGQLMSELVRSASEQGVRAINLTTGLFNTAAVRLYEHQGFKEVFRHGDGVQMRLDIK